MTRALVVAAAVLALLIARDAGAGVPTDQLHGSIDAILKIVTDPELKKEAETGERRKRIRTVVNQIFDFTEISQRSLGRHWQARTPAEREQFVALFGDLLENAYISKIESYSGEKIQYPGDVIEGHTDSVGGATFNLDLSRKRAEAVKRWLVDKGTIGEVRLTTVGYGLSRPVADNATEDGRGQNRRVELARR